MGRACLSGERLHTSVFAQRCDELKSTLRSIDTLITNLLN
jgi:hypothetical protein